MVILFFMELQLSQKIIHLFYKHKIVINKSFFDKLFFVVNCDKNINKYNYLDFLVGCGFDILNYSFIRDYIFLTNQGSKILTRINEDIFLLQQLNKKNKILIKYIPNY